MRFLVTGATGWIGALVVAELCRRGHELVCLVREDRGRERLRRLERVAPSRLSTLHGDVTQPLAGVSERDLQRLRGRVDRVLHVAALVRLDDGRKAELERINVEGTRQMLELSERLGIPAFDYVSSCSVAGNSSVFRESDGDEGQVFRNEYERTKLAGERLTADFRGSSTVLRVPGVVGESETGASASFSGTFYETLAAYFFLREDLELEWRTAPGPLEREGIRFDDEERLYLPLHAEFASDIDCAVVPQDWLSCALADVVEHPQARGTFHLVDPEPKSVGWVLGMALARLGIVPPIGEPAALGELGPWGRFVRRALRGPLRHHLPYLTAVPQLRSERLAALLGNRYLPPPRLDQDRLARLVDFAVAARFTTADGAL